MSGSNTHDSQAPMSARNRREPEPTVATGPSPCAGDGPVLQVVDCDSPPATEWNRAIEAAPEARIQQTWQAARIRRELEGCRPLFLQVRRGGEVAGQLLVSRGFIHPDLLQWCRPLLRTPWARSTLGVYRWFGGPIVLERPSYGEILRLFLAAVEERAVRDGVFAIQDAAPAFYDPHMDADLVDGIFQEFRYAGQERATIALELDGDLEAAWKNLNREARQKVNKARKQGIRIFAAETDEQLRQYYQVRRETARRNGVRPPHIDSVLAARPIYMAEGMAGVFLAEHDGQIASGQMLAVFNGNVHLGGVCYSDYAQSHNLNANDLMQWHVIEWAMARQCRRIDWAGYTLEPSTAKESGINRFKSKWGGTVLPYRSYSRVYGQKRQQVLDWLRDLKKRNQGSA